MVPITVVIADDQPICRSGVRMMLQGYNDIELIGEAANGEELLDVVKELRPDVVLCDIQMSPMNGMEATKRVSKLYPNSAVIALSVLVEAYAIMEMLQAGAVGYLIKEVEADILAQGIRAAHKRENYYSRTASHILSALIRAGRFDLKTLEIFDFTAQELRIIRLICDGKVQDEIATEIGVGLEAIRRSRKQINKKANVDGTPGLIMFALQNGIYKMEVEDLRGEESE